MTDSTSPAFVSNLPVNSLNFTATYTFYEPTVSRSYCEFSSHTIMDIKVNGNSNPEAVWFTSSCEPNKTNPSCSSVSINRELVKYPNTITFYMRSSIIRKTAPHLSPLITLDLNCRDYSHTFLTSHIVAPSHPIPYEQFYGHIYSFSSSDFTCNCPDTLYC